MNDKCFIDSNILVYAFDQNDTIKMEKARNLLTELKHNDFPLISVQTLGEFFNVTTRKFGFSKKIALEICDELSKMFPVCEINKNNVNHAMKLSEKTGYSYWDSLILSTAIDNECTVVYSEDLQHKQIIENIEIINPFFAAPLPPAN